MKKETINPVIIEELVDNRSTATSSPETDRFVQQHIERAIQFCRYPRAEITVGPEQVNLISFGADNLWTLLEERNVRKLKEGATENNLLRQDVGKELLKLRRKHESREAFVTKADVLLDQYALERAGQIENLVEPLDLQEGAVDLLREFGRKWQDPQTRRGFMNYGMGHFAMLRDGHVQHTTWDFRMQVGNGQPEYILRCPPVGVRYDSFLEPKKGRWYDGVTYVGIGYRPMVEISERGNG